MATIKSYTDIEQSKKLAEILPLESADMLWGYYYNGKNHCIPNIRPFRDGRNEIPKCYIPAWSLAALLSVLPAECECMSLEHINYGDNHKKYFMHYVGGENTEDYDNPVDACYEMIIKLNELKML